MRKLLASPIVAAILGGGVTAGVLLGAGVVDQGDTTTVYQQSPLAATQPASDDAPSGGLTAREIYKRDAPGVVFIQARTLTPDDLRAEPNLRGLNENFARELLELHTLGVDGGYTQDDVVNVARAFTGWTFGAKDGSGFRFAARLHDQGEKVVLGHRLEAGGGMEDGRKVLDILASHPSTARFIATKLATKFVSDTPPPALVERAARTFTRTHGNLREVTRVIVTSPEFLAPEHYRAKMKTPLEFVVGALRATGADVQSAQPIARALRELGMPLYLCQPPTGYDETGSTWVPSGALVARMNFALALGAKRLKGVTVPGLTGADLAEVRERMLQQALPGGASASTIATVSKASTAAQAVALIIGSPEFQKQ